jgi:glycosyltransferase involved in cell wall biosynthesis
VKILFDHPNPFLLAHGGFQIQIEQTKKALEEIGVEVEWLRWWDDTQSADLIHYFGVPSISYLQFAKTKNIPVILTHLLTSQCNRTQLHLGIQGVITQALLKLPGWGIIKNQLNWQSLLAAQQIIVGLEAERNVLTTVLGIPQQRISMIPLGLDEIFLQSAPSTRSADALVCVGTITHRKNSVALARLAKRAEVPILFVGKPYSESDAYWREFQGLIDDRWVRHQSHVADPSSMVKLLGSARGAVVMSDYENWCLVAHEAAACGLPVLLQDQKWSRERFGDQATYFERIGFSEANVQILKKFYEASTLLPQPQIKLYSWRDTAHQLEQLYSQILSAPITHPI